MPETIKTKIRGVTKKNEDGTSRQDLIQELSEGDILEIDHEFDNRYDSNALVVLSPSSERIGYLSADIAERYAPLLDAGGMITGKVLQITGDEETSLGVNVQLTIHTPEELPAIQPIQSLVNNQAISQPPTPKRRLSKKVIIIILVAAFILCVVICCLLGVYFFQYGQSASATETATALTHMP